MGVDVYYGVIIGGGKYVVCSESWVELVVVGFVD